MMGLEEIIRMLVGGAIGGVAVGLPMYLKANRQVATHIAEKSGMQIKEELIKDLRIELRERDADWQLRWDRREKEALEYRHRVEREFRVFRNVSQATAKDIRTLAAAGANTIPPEQLETQIHITGMGPLDP